MPRFITRPLRCFRATDAGGAVALTEVLKSRLVGVEPFDPIIWALAASALIVIALLASLLPARNATRVDVAETRRTL